MSGFCHLNLHSDRSQFIGLIKPGQLVMWCKEQGLEAACITDHDNISVAIALYKECKKAGLKPIFGMEASICPNKTKKDRASKNLILLAKNRIGFKNLVTLATIGSMYFYYRPRIDFTDLEKYGEGLIVSTACLLGVAAGEFYTQKQEGLRIVFDQYNALFGDDFYMEIQPALSETQRVYNEGLRTFADSEPRCKLLATGDPHYFYAMQREFHEQFMRVRYTLTKEGDWQYPFKGPYHVRIREEMDEQFGDLHGYDVNMVPVMHAALERPNEIIAKVESFDIREGVKIPTWSSG